MMPKPIMQSHLSRCANRKGRLASKFSHLARVVERTFAWLGRGRRLSKDYENVPENSETVVYIGSIRLMLKRLAK